MKKFTTYTPFCNSFGISKVMTMTMIQWLRPEMTSASMLLISGKSKYQNYDVTHHKLELQLILPLNIAGKR